MLSLSLVACNGQDPKPDADTGDTGPGPSECDPVLSDVPEADASEEGFGCVAVCHFCGDELVDSMTASGTKVNGEPGHVMFVAPCRDVAGGDPYQKDDGTAVPSGGAWSYTDDASIDCNTVGDAEGDWLVYLPAVDGGECEDYGEVDCEWLLNTEEYGDKAADSPKPTCIPGAGTFGLVMERWRDDNADDEGWSRLSPVLLEGDDYPERAWLRDVEVTDWGDASNLYILKYGFSASISNDELAPTHMIALDALNASASPASGVAPMGTFFAADGLDFDSGPMEMPTITLEWTCEQASPPNPLHYQNINPPQAYGARVKNLSGLGLTGVDQRILVRVDATNKLAVVEMQGRHHDRFAIPVEPEAGGVWSFDYENGSFGINAVGLITIDQDSAEVDFDALEVNGIDLGSPSWDLPQFAE